MVLSSFSYWYLRVPLEKPHSLQLLLWFSCMSVKEMAVHLGDMSRGWGGAHICWCTSVLPDSLNGKARCFSMTPHLAAGSHLLRGRTRTKKQPGSGTSKFGSRINPRTSALGWAFLQLPSGSCERIRGSASASALDIAIWSGLYELVSSL